MKVLAICGALAAASSNKQALVWATEVARAGVVVTLDQWLGRLPLFNPDLEQDREPPREVENWRAALREHDAALIACPEYGFSLPGALKNGIDWVIGSGELEGKPIATFCIVAGPGRGQRGLDALHTTLGAVSARLCGMQPIVRWTDDASRRRVRQELERLLELLEEQCASLPLG